jgi:hypothetical protein
MVDISRYLYYIVSATIALYVIFRLVDKLFQKLCNILKKDDHELENNQNTDNLKDSKPTAFDPRFFDLLVELTDKANQQKVEMTNQHKEFNQSQKKMEAKIQQIMEEQKIIIKMQKKEEKSSLQRHRDVVKNQEQSDIKLENFKKDLISQVQLELKKICLETRSSLQNQIKQQGVLQNLVLDLKPSKENQLGAGKKENELNNECKICMERPLATALTPCGHTVCFQCAKKLKSESKDCPTCRVKISGLQKIFLN